MWKYHSQIGNLYIRPMPDGTFGFEYRGIIWECCDTPSAEADNVRAHCTGCSDWDLYDGPNDTPRDLSDWTRV